MTPSVQNVVWNWRQSANERDKQSANAVLRRQAVIQALVMGAVGFVLFQWVGHVTFAKVVWGLAALVLVLGLAAPPAYRPIHGFGQWLGRAVGAILTYGLLVPLFYLVFAPVALVLRLRGIDPMQRKARGMEYTCWIPRTRVADVESYSRQFLLEEHEALTDLRPVGASRAATGEVQS